MTGGRPKFTRMVSVNVEVSPLEPTVKNWNRGFELGDFTSWTAVDAVISTVDPYKGNYCCNLTKTAASITQTLDDPMPVNAVFEFSAWFKRKAEGDAYTLRMIHTDGSTNDVSGSLTEEGWERSYFGRGFMHTGKILSGIAVISYAGDFYVDKVTMGLATEVITGALEVNQGTPENLQAEAVPRPKGSVLEADSVTTTDTYATVVSYTVPSSDWRFELAKILVSCPEDVMYRLRWNENVIGAEVYVTGGIPFTDWFPWAYKTMRGGDSKAFDIQAKYPAGGAAATCHAEIVGEYVNWDFN